MPPVYRIGLSILATVALSSPLPAVAQVSPELEGLAAACGANPDFFNFKVQGLDTDPVRLGALCGCLVGAFQEYPQADIVMLTKDLDGSATTEDRTAYGDYTALEAKALAALDTCVAQTAPAPEPATDDLGAADMSGFDEACLTGGIMLEVAGGEEQRVQLCACLSAGLEPRVSSADIAVLAEDVAGRGTEQSHAAHGNYDALAELAGGVLDQCFTELPAPASP
jgi:hypothetical protein